uniref:solute carrier family 26 member 6-like n=1 Tax=Styela clava TaxID=7725 RepID=UPI001939546B|nr:solute carrier family 26 member 6-like [Styela clava]
MAAAAANDDFNIRLESIDIDQFYTEDQLHKRYGIPREEVKIKTRVKNSLKETFQCSCEKVTRFFTTLIPILSWLPQYNIKDSLLGDLVGGFTVGIVHLPQGMAYGMLASLPPVHGLYVSFFPVLMYAILGTVRQNSIGTFAVICIMVGEVIDEHVKEEDYCGPQTSTTSPLLTTIGVSETSAADINTSKPDCEDLYLSRKIEIAAALCVAVGIIQIIMYLLRLGVITTYLSEHLVSGFTCGSAFHVLTSQVSKLVGITVEKYSGPLSLVYTYVDIFSNITEINWATVIVSTICIIVLIIGKEINAKFYDKLPIPIPWEFAVVIFSTIASYYGLFYGNHDVIVVGDIPTGFRLSVPKGPDIGAVMLEAIPIAIVIYAIEISLGKMFAMKHGYDIDSNQELMALGSSNIFSSFFSCFPCAASLSRSVIWDEVGGKTQITGFVSSSIILIILLWLGPLFESLPQAALAAIIVVNLKRMLRQFDKISGYWKVCKLDAVTWLVTWLSVVLLGVDIGLLVGVSFELVTVVCNTQIANGYVLGEVEETGNYKNVKRYQTKRESDKNIIIFSYSGPLYFANHERFRGQLIDALGFDPSREVTAIKDLQAKAEKRREKEKADESKLGVENMGFTLEKGENVVINDENDSGISTVAFSRNSFDNNNADEEKTKEEEDTSSNSSDVIFAYGITHVVLNMPACSYVDNDGAKTIKSLFSSLKSLDIQLIISSCNDTVRRALNPLFETSKPPFFLSLEGAVSHARGEILLNFDEHGNVIGDMNIKRRGTIF